MKEPELTTYWIVVYVSLPKALPIQDAGGSGIPSSAIGYYQKFGVTQSSEDAARQLVARQISPVGLLDWGESVVSTVDVERLDPMILARSGDWRSPGIWYKSGRIFVASDAADSTAERIRDRWVLRILATLAALLFTVAGSKIYFMGLPLVSEKIAYLLNPGAILVNWIWPEGPHTGTFLAAFSFLFLIAADLVIWWIVAYFLVLTPAYRILARVRS